MATYPRCTECDADLMQDREIESGFCDVCNPPPIIVATTIIELNEKHLKDLRDCGAQDAAIIHEYFDRMPQYTERGERIYYDDCVVIEK